MPSAVIETQLVSSARISTLKVLVEATGAADAAPPVLELGGDEFAGGVVAALVGASARLGSAEGLPDDVIPVGGVLDFSGAAACGGWLVRDGGALTGGAAGA